MVPGSIEHKEREKEKEKRDRMNKLRHMQKSNLFLFIVCKLVPWLRYKKLNIISPNPKLLWMHNSAVKYVAAFLVLLDDTEAVRRRSMTSSENGQRHFIPNESLCCYANKPYSLDRLHTCAKFDCFDGSFRFGMCAANCRLRVTERANFANFDKPGNLIKRKINHGTCAYENVVLNLILEFLEKLTAFRVLGIHQLFEGSYITECQQQQYN